MKQLLQRADCISRAQTIARSHLYGILALLLVAQSAILVTLHATTSTAGSGIVDGRPSLPLHRGADARAGEVSQKAMQQWRCRVCWGGGVEGQAFAAMASTLVSSPHLSALLTQRPLLLLPCLLLLPLLLLLVVLVQLVACAAHHSCAQGVPHPAVATCSGGGGNSGGGRPDRHCTALDSLLLLA